MSLLVLDNIFKEFRNKNVLNGVSLRIERGERVALTGPNGSGKSTLLKIAMGLESCDRGSVIVAGNIKVGYISQDMSDVSYGDGKTALDFEKVSQMEQRLRELEGEMEKFSNDRENINCTRLLNEYSKLLDAYEAIDGYTIEAKIKRTLLGLGLKMEALNIPVDLLSGGERMRVAIARTLLEEPELLILDEPTNHLDIGATQWLEGFLKRFEGGVLLVSHDRYFLDQVATRVGELDGGGITLRGGNYSSFLMEKQVMREFMLKEQRRIEGEIRRAGKLVQEFKRKRNFNAARSREIAMNRMKVELQEKVGRVREREHLGKVSGPKIAFKNIKHVSKDIAWAEGLVKSFGKAQIFNNASFHIRGGERIAIIGPNGCGKTTLINILLGKDKDFTGLARLGEWVKYSYMGQEIDFEDENRTVLQEITLNWDMNEADARQHLARFQYYGDEVDKSIEVLSGGERVRLFLARIMLENADCIIMDEPTNHLDVPGRDAIEAALKSFRGTVISVTHDRYFLNRCVDRILEIEDGKINSYQGNYDFYINEKKRLDDNKSEVKRKPLYTANEVEASKAKSKRDMIRQEEIETKIIELEEKAREIEDSFGASTPREAYSEYDILIGEIQRLYDIWEGIIQSG